MMSAYDFANDDIVLYTHPNYNHDDVPAGSIDMNNELKPGDKINVEEIVCNALIAPNGYAYYANDYGHADCARALGMDGVEDAMNKGYIHVAVTYTDISHYVRPTASQKRTLHEMYFTAVMNKNMPPCKTYINAFVYFASDNGIEIE
jgi:hypothetical protein